MSSKQVFFIGIKGVGMTSLALAMQDAGWIVSGSDTGESFITDDILEARHISVAAPVLSPIPPATDLVVYSGAYDISSLTSDVLPLKSLSLAQALAEFVKDRKIIAVAGVGGKTTTSAMLASLFHALNRPVGYYVGTGSISGLAAPGAAGTDPWYVVESDEYAISKSDKRPKFALLTPQIVVTTNIIHDHPDIYPDEQATRAVFADLIASIPAGGTWICNPADPLTAQILSLRGPSLKAVKVVQYGSDHPLYSQLNLSVFGDQNRLDALAAVLGAIASGVSESDAMKAITSYHGAGRRQEFHGEIDGRLLYDDYGHHPREIELTVQSFKEHFPSRRLILVFESHTYTRTESLLDDFAKAIAIADLAFIMPIFESAREKGQPHSITPESFAALIPGAASLTWDNAAKSIWDASRPGDVILTMGAGFVYKLHELWTPARSDLEGSAQPDHTQQGGKV
jgi:UDP-N-acetylmuramate--alanine ligase